MESGQHKYRHHARTGPCHDPRRLSRPHHGQQLVLVFCQKRRCPRPRPPRAHRRQKQHGWRAPVTSKPVTVVRAPERARATALYSACALRASGSGVGEMAVAFPAAQHGAQQGAAAVRRGLFGSGNDGAHARGCLLPSVVFVSGFAFLEETDLICTTISASLGRRTLGLTA